MITIKTQIAFLHLLICYGCKVNKEKSERLLMDSQSQGSMQVSSEWRQFNSQDSSYRYWYYTGDSSFYFHPDAGLWSRSGQLVYAEQRALQQRVTGITQHYDSLGAESNKAQSQTQVKIVSSPMRGWMWLLAIIPVLTIYWFWRRR